MRRFYLLIMMITICGMVMGQGKITPQAKMRIAKQKAKVERQNAKAPGMVQKEQRLTLVVKVAEENASKTFAEMRAKGAVVKSKIGQQAVVSVPLENVDAISEIPGVTRIDNGHKPKWKTDITREETGVNILNGPNATASEILTGKGVTICILDEGIDFQHPAFKDKDGNSRIKAVYVMNAEDGTKITLEDPDAGTITLPGSVYDTPELIAKLTTDDDEEYHGTHTAGIAAGSLSPMGFGGMAPEADIVLVPFGDSFMPDDLNEFDDMYASVELALSFASAYAQKNQQPMVLSFSANDHMGPHDGTGTIPDAIESISEHLIPVLSAGNEGGYPIHLYRKFTSAKPSFKTVLALSEDEDNANYYTIDDQSICYTRTGDKVSVKIGLAKYNQFTGKTTQIWSTDEYEVTPASEETIEMISSDDDESLAQYFEGDLGIYTYKTEDGRLVFTTSATGTLKGFIFVTLTVAGSPDTEIDMWDSFGGFNIFGLGGFATGDAEMSAGDWTTTPSVISVGAYCTNTTYRSYDGSPEEESDFEYKTNEIAEFSSYGEYPNGVSQPTICAPGVNIVSAMNHYMFEGGIDEMLWDGYPYGAESGTSMACPVVSGIVALWLQTKPELTLDDIKKVMNESSVNDEFTAKTPIRWGYGKINALKGIEYISQMDGINEIAESSRNGDVMYDLQGRRVNKAVNGIYIMNGRKVVVR